MKVKVTRKDIEAGRYNVRQRCDCPIHIALARKLRAVKGLEIPVFQEAKLGRIRIPLPEQAIEFQSRLWKNPEADVKPFEFETELIAPKQQGRQGAMSDYMQQRVEVAEDYCPGCNYLKCECDPLQRALSGAAIEMNSRGWRILLAAHDHVWRDRQWEWRTRFDVTALLWNKAIALCRERIVGRAA